MPDTIPVKDIQDKIILLANGDLYYWEYGWNEKYEKQPKITCEKIMLEGKVKQVLGSYHGCFVLMEVNKQDQLAYVEYYHRDTGKISLTLCPHPLESKVMKIIPYYNNFYALFENGNVFMFDYEFGSRKISLENVSQFYHTENIEFAVLKDGSLVSRLSSGGPFIGHQGIGEIFEKEDDNRFFDDYQRQFENVPLELSPNVKIKEICGGQYHTLILLSNGEVWVAGLLTGEMSSDRDSCKPQAWFKPLEGAPENIVQMCCAETSRKNKVAFFLLDNGEVWSYKSEFKTGDDYGISDDPVPTGVNFITKLSCTLQMHETPKFGRKTI